MCGCGLTEFHSFSSSEVALFFRMKLKFAHVFSVVTSGFYCYVRSSSLGVAHHKTGIR